MSNDRFDNDGLGDALRSAAGDLRSETDSIHIPDFSPRSSAAGPFAAGVAAAVLVIGGFFAVGSLRNGSDGQVDVATSDPTTVPPATSEPTGTPDPTTPTTTNENADLPPLPGAADPFVDPDTGRQIVRLTSAEPTGAIAPAHSESATFNPSGSLVILYEQGEGHWLFDGDTLERVRPIGIASDDVYNWSWHPSDPDLALYPDGSGTNQLRQLNVRTNESLVAFTATDCDQIGQGGALGSTANGTSHMGLLCTRDGADYWMSYNILSGTVTIAASPTDSGTAPISAAQDGSLFVVFGSTETRVLDGTFTPINPDPRAGDAASSVVLTRTSDQTPIALTTLYDEPDGQNGLAVAFDLGSGTRIGIIDERTVYPPSGSAMSGSLLSGQAAIAAATSPDGEPFAGQVTLVNPGETPEQEVLVTHRMSIEDFQGSEWGDGVIVAMDPLGRYVLFSSDWGTQRSTNTYAILLNG